MVKNHLFKDAPFWRRLIGRRFTTANCLISPHCTLCPNGYSPGTPSPPLDNIWVMVIVWRLRGNIIGTALCWVVWHNVHSQQHTYVSSSYRSSRLGLSHWDPYAMH